VGPRLTLTRAGLRYASERVVRSSKYPLASLSRFRDGQVDMTAGELARAADAVERAKQTHAAANEAQAKHRGDAAEMRAVERAALTRGELRAGDLVTGEAWGLRIQAEDRVLQGHTDAARAKETQAEGIEREARARLASRKVDADIVHKHRARYDETQRKAAEARDEEASFEAWRPKR
jgi:hypothetical protein